MHRLLRAVAMGRAVRAGRVVKFEEIHHNSLVCASNSCKMVLKGFLYNTVFRRNSTYAAFIVAGAVLGENFLNDVVDSNWRESNKGVRAPQFICCSSSVLFAASFYAVRRALVISHPFQKLFNDQEFAQSK